MAQVHALLAGSADVAGLDKYGCIAGSYRVMGTNLFEKVVSDPTDASAFLFPVVSATQRKLYVKRASGEIWRYDLDGFANPEFVGAFGNRGNFLVDDNTGALYALNHFGDLVKMHTVHKGPVATTAVVAAGIFDPDSFAYFSSEPVLQWRRPPGSSETSEICIQISDGGSLLYFLATGRADPFPAQQAILTFDPVNSVLLPDFIPKTGGSTANSIWPSTCFAFGPDGLVYVVKSFVDRTLPPQVWRFDGTTGAFKDVFISQGITQNPGQILFAPDGNSVLLAVADFVYQYDLSGTLIGTIPRPSRTGYSTFATEDVDLPSPKAVKPPYALLIGLLAGIVGDNPGWVRRPGRHWPEPWGGWDLAAERMWNSLSSDERDAVIACGIRRLSSMMATSRADEEIQRVLASTLGEKALARLALLLEMHGYDRLKGD
jgi:hypothetical protein